MPARPVYDYHGHHYEDVAGYDEATSSTVVPNGETWRVVRFIGNGAYLDDTAAELWWDRGGAQEKLLAATHGDADMPIDEEVTGDGSRALTIVLTNDTSSAHVLGGRWDAEKV